MQEIINEPDNFELEKEISTYKYIFEGFFTRFINF